MADNIWAACRNSASSHFCEAHLYLENNKKATLIQMGECEISPTIAWFCDRLRRKEFSKRVVEDQQRTAVRDFGILHINIKKAIGAG